MLLLLPDRFTGKLFNRVASKRNLATEESNKTVLCGSALPNLFGSIQFFTLALGRWVAEAGRARTE